MSYSVEKEHEAGRWISSFTFKSPSLCVLSFFPPPSLFSDFKNSPKEIKVKEGSLGFLSLEV